MLVNELVVATVPTVYGIETMIDQLWLWQLVKVATVPTVYGIETMKLLSLYLPLKVGCNSTYRLRY